MIFTISFYLFYHNVFAHFLLMQAKFKKYAYFCNHIVKHHCLLSDFEQNRYHLEELITAGNRI